MKKKHYNYIIFFTLIFLVAFSFTKKNNFIIFTISPIGSHQLENIEIINSELEKNILISNLNYIIKEFNQFYIDDYTFNKINKIYPNIKIVNKEKYFTVTIKDNKKKIEDIERIEILLNNFLLNQNIIVILKNIEKMQKELDKIKYKKIYEERRDELIKIISFYQKLHKEIKNNDVRFFKILQEF